MQSEYKIITVPDSSKVFDLIRSSGNKKIIVATTLGIARERIKIILKEKGIKVKSIKNINESAFGDVSIADVNIHNNFEKQPYLFLKEDLFLDKNTLLRSVRHSKKETVRKFNGNSNLEEGSLVVHRDYGIGSFDGFKKIEQAECLSITYKDGKLYVPIEKINQVTPYKNSIGTKNTELNSMYEKKWQSQKKKATTKITQLALEIIKNAGIRESKKSTVYDIEDNINMINKFEKDFHHIETEDQLVAISDIYQDLASGKPMDRLICGDVGFGKTEVAMRAIFAVLAGAKLQKKKGQVAFVCPMTLLAKQHFRTLKKRFSNFPEIRIEILNSEVSLRKKREIYEDIKNGDIQLVVGTHSVLNKGIDFSKLDLIVFDEEQKFGVEQKDILKNRFNDAHYLSLSATPIPRTLSSALSGLKDISVISTPPLAKKPIITHVAAFGVGLIGRAVKYESDRGGQTLIITPRIKDIEDLVDKLCMIVPRNRIAILHGKITHKDRDEILRDIESKYSIIVATTIIATGMDFGQSNTIIVNNAEMFGVSELHQIRGRIGRREEQAVCYLLIDKRFVKNQEKVHRLKVLQSLNHFGAGLEVSSMDLEKRGGGNIIGKEQSGHMDHIGINLYQELLSEEVERLKSSQSNSVVHVDLETKFSGIIPDRYINSVKLKIEFYRKLTSPISYQESMDIRAEMIDRFGDIPEEVEVFFGNVKLREFCSNNGINKMKVREKSVTFSMKIEGEERLMKVLKIINESKNLSFENQNLIKLSSVTEIKNAESVIALLQPILLKF